MKKQNKISIIWLHSHFLYFMGGTKFVYEVTKRLVKKSDVRSVVMIVENSSDFVRDLYHPTGVKVKSINGITSNSMAYWAFLPLFIYRDYVFAKGISKKIQLQYPKDSVVVISSMFPMNIVGYFLGFNHIQNCFEPFAFFYDASFVAKFSVAKRFLISLLGKIYSPLDIFFSKRSSVMVTLNSTTQQLVSTIYKRSSILTQAGVDSKLFHPFVGKKILTKYNGKQIIIHSTDYSPVKGTDKVIRAFSKICNTYPNALLIITTTIENQVEKQKLQNLCRRLGATSKIEFAGFVSISDLPQLYSIALVLVQGSSSPKSGTTSMALPVKEALCCGTPVIRSEFGQEDTIPWLTGIICSADDEQRLSVAMSLFLKRSDFKKKMGYYCRKNVVDVYTWDKTTDVFYSSSRKLLKKMS